MNEPYDVLLQRIQAAGEERKRRSRNLNSSSDSKPTTLINEIVLRSTDLSIVVEKIRNRAGEYDFDTPFNGYRTFVKVAERLARVTAILLQNNSPSLSKLRQLATCHQSLLSMFDLLHDMMANNPAGELITRERFTMMENIKLFASIETECYFGDFMGLQYREDSFFLQKIKGLFGWITKEVSPERRARKIVDMSKHANVNEIRTMWGAFNNIGLRLLIKTLKPIAYSSPCEIDIPGSGKKVKCRLISSVRRQGLMGGRERLSPGMIIHLHGGGFVALSAKAEEVYLRDWAKTIQVPILSIDYSLAPECPYPVAILELVAVYEHVLSHAPLYGSEGRKIIIAGESAGASLVAGATVMCIEKNIPLPHALFLANFPVYMNFSLTPSRLICGMDPFIPFGFLLRCFQAYVGGAIAPPEEQLWKDCLFCDDPKDASHRRYIQDVRPSMLIPDIPHTSPLYADDDVLRKMPPILFSSSSCDPCMDEMLDFAKKLRRLGNKVEFDIADGLPHGYFLLSFLHEPCQKDGQRLAEKIKNLLNS